MEAFTVPLHNLADEEDGGMGQGLVVGEGTDWRVYSIVASARRTGMDGMAWRSKDGSWKGKVAQATTAT